MNSKTPLLGILQGRLTPSPDGKIQFFPKDNWKKEFVIAKQLGFDCVEWLIKKESSKENPFWQPHANYLDKISPPILSVHGFYDKGPSYSTILGAMVINASVIGAKTILLSFFNDNTLKTEDDKRFAQEQIFPVIPFCQNLKIRIGIETEMPVEELSEFVRSFNHPNIGVYYDIGNMASMGVNVAEEIKLLGDYICGVHIKDRLPNGGKTVPLGSGCADFESAFRALRDVGYGGPLIIQGARVIGVDDIELNRDYLDFCSQLLGKVYEGGE